MQSKSETEILKLDASVDWINSGSIMYVIDAETAPSVVSEFKFGANEKRRATFKNIITLFEW